MKKKLFRNLYDELKPNGNTSPVKEITKEIEVNILLPEEKPSSSDQKKLSSTPLSPARLFGKNRKRIESELFSPTFRKKVARLQSP